MHAADVREDRARLLGAPHSFENVVQHFVLPQLVRLFFDGAALGLIGIRQAVLPQTEPGDDQTQWKPAAAIYEKLAFAGGARSEEAKARLDRLRLEHFLWEE